MPLTFWALVGGGGDRGYGGGSRFESRSGGSSGSRDYYSSRYIQGLVRGVGSLEKRCKSMLVVVNVLFKYSCHPTSLSFIPPEVKAATATDLQVVLTETVTTVMVSLSS